MAPSNAHSTNQILFCLRFRWDGIFFISKNPYLVVEKKTYHLHCSLELFFSKLVAEVRLSSTCSSASCRAFILGGRYGLV